jgi:integrase/recombinase XerD
MQVKMKAILWKHKEAANGEHEIRIRITIYKEVVYLNTGFTSSENNWDQKNDCPKSTHPKFKVIIKKIGELTDAIDFEVKLLLKNGIDTFSLSDLKNKVKAPIKKNSKIKILELYESVIGELESEERIGYSKVFISSRDNLKKFLRNVDLPFIGFSKKEFENYEQFLLKNVKQESSISVYIRTFTRLWNIAIERGHCPKEHHPSKYFKFKPYRRFKTKKRAVSSDVIKAIEGLPFDKTSRLYRSRQYFLFSYFARGMNFIDLAKLRYKENFLGNELNYIRSKNKRRYQFQLHSKALAIVEVFLSYHQQSDAGFLFPILHSIHNTAKKIDDRIDSALKDLNEDLKQMGQMIGVEKHLTSYVARHSFATNLRQKNVGISIIQEALGHETELQTSTYLEDIDDSIIALSIENAL